MENELNNIVIDYLSDPDNTAKAAAVQQWLSADASHPPLFLEIKQVWEAGRTLPEDAFDRQAGWQQLSAQITPGKNTPVRAMRTRWWWAAAIALPVLAFAGYRYLNSSTPQWHDYVAKGNTTDSLRLPDGSDVFMKPGTTLSYRNRQLRMTQGEAFFRIAKDEQTRFSIAIPNGNIQVLGTSFNVKTTSSYSDVAVWDGKVSVQGNKGTAVTLTAGNLAIVNAATGDIAKPEGDYAWRCGWSNHDLAFSNQELTLIMQTVASFYHVTLHVPNEDMLKFKATVRFNNVPLHEALQVLSEILDLNVDKENDSTYYFQYKRI
jgi:transmembrane sensor